MEVGKVVFKTIIPQIMISLLIGGIGLFSGDLSAQAQAKASLNSQQRQQLYKLLQQGEKYVVAGNVNNALSIYRQAASLDRSNPKIFF